MKNAKAARTSNNQTFLSQTLPSSSSSSSKSKSKMASQILSKRLTLDITNYRLKRLKRVTSSRRTPSIPEVLSLLLLTSTLLYCVCLTDAFNLDTKLPVFKRLDSEFSNSYFGFSLAFSNETNEVYVGAPKALLGKKELGLVFRCPINFGSKTSKDCISMGSSLGIDDEEEWRNGQWLGARITSVGSNEYEQVVACAHRFWTTTGNHRNSIGKCLQFEPRNADPRVIHLNPCDSGSEHNFKGVCQAGLGLSASPTPLSELNSLDATIGTPGFCDFVGGIFHRNKDVFSASFDKNSNFYTGKQKTKSTCKKEKLTEESVAYLGYTILHVNGIKFRTKKGDVHDDLILASAPRHKGQVIFYSKPPSGCASTSSNPKKCHPHPLLDVSLVGPALGAYFGASLAAGPLAGVREFPQFQVIAVGAPFLHEKDIGEVRSGAVFLYDQISISNQQYLHKLQGPGAHSGFGTSLAISNLDNDDFDDLIVGAPFFMNKENSDNKNENRGAIFVYRGRKDLQEIQAPSQIIMAEDFGGEMALHRFGHALVGGQDLNGDGFKDVVVGSYKSDSIIALFSRPVVQIRAVIRYREDGIKIGDRFFDVDVCFSKPSAPVVDGPIRLAFNLVEITSSTRKLRPGNPVNKLLLEGEALFPKGLQRKCVEKLQLSMVDQVPSYEDVGLKLTFSQMEMEEKEGEEEGKRKEELDVIMDSPAKEVTRKIPFKTACSGPKKSCLNDLEISITDITSSSSSSSKEALTLVVGERKMISFRLLIKNRGPDPAYQVKLNSSRPSAVEVDILVEKKPWLANEASRVVDQLLQGESVELKVEAAFQEFGGHKDRIQMEFGVYSDIVNHKEESPEDTVTVLSLQVKRSTDLRLFGQDTKSQVIFERRSEGDIRKGVEFLEDIGPEVNHKFVVVNEGPSGVAGLLLTIQWPVAFASGNQPLLYLHRRPLINGIEDSEGPEGFRCKIEDRVNSLRLEARPTEGEALISKRQAEEEEEEEEEEEKEASQTDNERLKRAAYPPPSYSQSSRLLSNATLTSATVLDCEPSSSSSSSSQRLRCVTIFCQLPAMERDQIVVEVKSRLWIDSLLTLSPKQEAWQIKSRGYVVMKPEYPADYFEERNLTNNEANPISFAYKTFKEEPKELPLWVILVSALGGILLLLVLIFILWKCNFFKRKKIEGGPQYKAVKTKELTKDPEEAELETLNWNYS